MVIGPLQIGSRNDLFTRVMLQLVYERPMAQNIDK